MGGNSPLTLNLTFLDRHHKYVFKPNHNIVDVDHLSQKSNSMESRLEKLEKLLAQREEEDYYISGIGKAKNYRYHETGILLQLKEYRIVP